MGSLGGWEIVIILGVLVLLFGAKKLPDMARSVGQSARVFKGEMKGLKEDGKDGSTPAPPAAPAPLPPVQQDVTPQAAPNPTHTPGSSSAP
jgi:sec-independent protein translocase protein TatA